MYYEFRKARDTAEQKLNRGQTGKRWAGDKERKEDKKLFDFQLLFRKWARAPPPNRFLGEDRESGQSSDVFAFDLLLYETRTKTDTASLAQVEQKVANGLSTLATELSNTAGGGW